MSEPSLKFCTKRDGYGDYWDGVSDAPFIDLECRFSDGQKFAAVRIDAEFPILADKIANFLNAGTSDNKRLDEIIANAIAGIPETDVAILAREVVRLREEAENLRHAARFLAFVVSKGRKSATKSSSRCAKESLMMRRNLR